MSHASFKDFMTCITSSPLTYDVLSSPELAQFTLFIIENKSYVKILRENPAENQKVFPSHEL